MTAQPAALESAIVSSHRGRPLLGLGTVVRKELAEWIRGPKALIILGVSVLGAIFMTLIPFIVPPQLFAAHLSEAKGLDPDAPRSLTKVTKTL